MSALYLLRGRIYSRNYLKYVFTLYSCTSAIKGLFKLRKSNLLPLHSYRESQVLEGGMMTVEPWRVREQTVLDDMSKATNAKTFSYYIIADNHNYKKYYKILFLNFNTYCLT